MAVEKIEKCIWNNASDKEEKWKITEVYTYKLQIPVKHPARIDFN